jgi:hypothetical protein
MSNNNNNNNNNNNKNNNNYSEEARQKAEVMSEVYARVRERMRQRGGMVTTAQEALQQIVQEDAQNISQALEDMIAAEEEEDPHNKSVLEAWRNLPPDKVLALIDNSLANYLKNEVQPTDRRFYWHKLAYHSEPESAAKFEKMLQELKRNGLM